MKLLALLVAALVATASVDGATNRPGSCKDDKDCAADYTCVSVQTTREGVINVKQCLPTKKGTPVCTGIIPGLCPSFSTTWGAAFRQISSVCAYILPEGKNIKCLADPTNSTKGGVECLFVQNPANTSEQLGVIYGCVDFDGQRLLFDKKSKSDKIASSFNYSEIIEKSCVNPKNPQGSTFVCSSQGTCSPSSANSMSYSCKCNIGFQGKYCEKIVNNECYHDGVCGGGSCDLVKNECKDCPPGTMGNKCAQCDPSYDATKVCGGHGTCVPSSGDSTLGADGSAASSGTSSSNSTSASSGSSDSKTTKAPSKTTKAPSTTSDGSGSAMGPGSVTAPSLNRLLMSMATTNQCKCDEGWTDANCAVKVKAAASSNSSASTPAPSSAAVSVTGVAGSMVAVVSVTLAAVFSA